VANGRSRQDAIILLIWLIAGERNLRFSSAASIEVAPGSIGPNNNQGRIAVLISGRAARARLFAGRLLLLHERIS
jgi:hypothetical protein